MKRRRGWQLTAGRGKFALLAMALVVSMLAVVAVACGDDDEVAAPAPAAPAAPAPTAAPAAPAPTAAPAAPAAPAATAVPAAAPPASKPAAPTALATRDYWLIGAGERPKRGGIFRVAETNEVETLDTHVSHRGRNSSTVSVMNEVLMKWHLIDPDTFEFGMRPALVTSWEEPDSNTIILDIRKGIKFQDGSDLNAQVVKWNLDRMRTEPKFPAKQQLGHIGSVDVVGNYTIRINIPKPTAVNLVSLGTHFSIISKAQFDSLGAEGYGFNPSGTGPMQLKAWVPDVKKTTEPFTGYWRDGVDGQKLPYLDGIEDRVILQGGVAIAEMETNQLDMFKLMEADQVPVAERSAKLEVVPYTWTGTQRPILGMNSRSGPFTDIRLRQAGQYALDREAQAKAFGPTGKAHFFPYNFPGFFTWDTSLPKYTYDPDKARALVKEVDPDGQVEVTLSNICREPDNSMALVVKAMWDAVGLKTAIDCQEVVTWVNKNRADDFVATFWRGNQVGPDPDMEYRNIDRESASNWGNLTTPGLAECWLEGRFELDQAKRKAIYARCYKLLHEGAALSVSFLETPNHVQRVEVRGVGVEATIATYLQEVWLDE